MHTVHLAVHMVGHNTHDTYISHADTLCTVHNTYVEGRNYIRCSKVFTLHSLTLACTHCKMSTSMVAIVARSFSTKSPCQMASPCKWVPSGVHVVQVQWSCRPQYRATTSNPCIRKMCVEMLLDLWPKMDQCPIMLKPYHGKQPGAHLQVALVQLIAETHDTQRHWDGGGVGVAESRFCQWYRPTH